MPARTAEMRVVVNLVGDAEGGMLAESRFVARPFLPGGEHNMYEFAFAAAELGFEVELRGWLERTAFERLAHGTGPAPIVDLSPRAPETGELVVVPEGWRDPLDYLRLLLSPGRLALYLLAPPGLFGWPFTGPGWTLPDPITVPLDSVARPEHFQAIDRLGIALLTHSPGIAAAAHDAGVECTFVGVGRTGPLTPRPAGEREVDVVALTANRWEPLVREVTAQLDGCTVELLDEVPNERVLERFSHSKVLLWPSRIEGHATIPWEARSVGCVPVALSTNRFAVGLTDSDGAVLAERVEELAPAIKALLADEPRLRELSKRAEATAPGEVHWGSYVERVRGFLGGLQPSGPEQAARSGMGQALRELERGHAERAHAVRAELDAELARVRADRDEIHREEQALRTDRDRIALERQRLALELQQLSQHPALRVARRLGAISRRNADVS